MYLVMLSPSTIFYDQGRSLFPEGSYHICQHVLRGLVELLADLVPILNQLPHVSVKLLQDVLLKLLQLNIEWNE